MRRSPNAADLERLENDQNCWLATVRKDGRPHLVPVWFVWWNGSFFVGMKETSVKARNLQRSNLASVSLEDGNSAIICEGKATTATAPYPEPVLEQLKAKYDWDFSADADYNHLVRIDPVKWMIWGEEGNYA